MNRPALFPVVCAIAALPLSHSAAEEQRFATVRAGGWTITDEEATCDASFAVDGEDVLRFSGPTYGWKDGPSGGSLHHIGFRAGQYALPKGEFAVTVHGEPGPSFRATGEAVEMDGGLLVFADGKAPALAILEQLPNAGPIIFSVKGHELFRVMLSGNDRAIAAHKACMAFITAQKRPGTRDSGEMPRPPKPLPPPEMLVPPPPPASAPPVALPDAAPPVALPEAPAAQILDPRQSLPRPAAPKPR